MPFPLFCGEQKGENVLVVQTGAGPRRAADAATWLIEHEQVSGFLSVGLSGGLAPALQSGALVMGSEWSLSIEKGDPARSIGPTADERLRERARRAAACCGVELREGRLLTVPRVVSTVEEKSAFAADTEAIAVDMESGAIAEVAMAASRQCLAVRAILDPADRRLDLRPDQFLREDGCLSLWKSGLAVAAQPGQLPSWLALGRQSGRAMSVLTHWLCQFLYNSE